MGVTAIQDRLELTMQEAKQFCGLGYEYNPSVKLEVLASPPASSVVYVMIQPSNRSNSVKISVTTPALPTSITVAAQLVAAIGVEFLATEVAATDHLDGTYTVANGTVSTSIEVFPDNNQDIVESDTDDVILRGYMDVAKVAADKYCNNPFYKRDEDGNLIDSSGDELLFDPEDHELLYEDGRVAIDIPAPVKIGVLQLLRYLWKNYLQEVDGTMTAIGPLESERAGDRSVKFATGDFYGDMTSFVKELPGFVTNLLGAYRIVPGM